MMTRSIIMMIMFLSISISCNRDGIVQGDEDDAQTNELALDFTEKDSRGEIVSLAPEKGKVILLNFSAMWCGPCRAEAPELEAIYEKYKGRGLKIIQCIYDNESRSRADESDLLRWIQEFNLSFSVINDPDFSTLGLYKVSRIPLNLVIDREFYIQYRREGFFKEELIQSIESHL